jgi:serine phosphatase RsbU (regulator of sigma subunit)
VSSMGAAKQRVGISGRLEALFGLGVRVAAAESEGDVLDVIVDQGAGIAGAAAAVVGVADGDSVRVVAERGYEPGYLDRRLSFPLEPGTPMSDVIVSGSPVYCSSRAERDERWPVFRGAGSQAGEAFVVLPLAGRRGMLGALTLSFREVLEFDPDERSFLEAFASQCALSLERIRAAAEEERLRDELTLIVESERRARYRTERLQRYTARLAPALKVDEVAEIAVDKALVASGGVTALLALESPDGRIEIRRVDGQVTGEMRAKRFLAADDASVVGEVFRSHAPRWITNRREWDRYPEALGRPEGLRSAALLPVGTPDRFFGVLGIAFDHEREFPTDEQKFLSAIAAQTAQALDRAILHEEHAHIAQVLQQSLLPHSLPEVPGVAISASYRAAGELNEAGGDFYDVFETDAGHLLVIGDVCGKGPEAAALTALCRYTLRAAALQSGGSSPAQLLALLNRAILAQGGGDNQFASVACVLLQRGELGVTATLASAGHPPTLVRARDGELTAYSPTGTPAGLMPDCRYNDELVSLSPGDLLVLHTDGLTDARAGNGDRLGETPIWEALEALGPAPTPVQAIGALEALLNGLETPDDIAIVAAVVR